MRATNEQELEIYIYIKSDAKNVWFFFRFSVVYNNILYSDIICFIPTQRHQINPIYGIFKVKNSLAKLAFQPIIQPYTIIYLIILRQRDDKIVLA